MAITDQVGQYLPTFSSGGVGLVLIFIIVLIVALTIVALIGFALYNYLVYNKKLIIFEKINGRFSPTRKDKVRNVKLDKSGDVVWYARKNKKFLPPGQIQTGPRTYWYFVRSDGEWINIGLEDIDEKMKDVKAHFLDKEMRYARAALQRNFRERYDKVGFWAKYGGLVMYTLLIVLVGIMVYLLFDKFIEISGSIASAVESQRQVMELAKEVLSAVDNIKTGGSGFESA